MFPALLLLTLADLALVVLPLLARGSNSNYFWGVNLWRYLPGGSGYAFGVIALGTFAGALLLSLRRSGTTPAPREAAPAPGGSDPAGWALAAIAGASLSALLFLFQEKIHFLGDTILRTRATLYIASGFPMPRDYSILHTAPLDKWLLVGIPGFLGRLTPADPLLCAHLVPCLMGGAMVLAAYGLACQLTARSHLRALLTTFLVGQGYLQLFAGYLEAYGLQLLVILLWFGALAREARLGREAAWSSALFGFSLLAHRDGLLLLPAQLWWTVLSRPANSEAPGRPWISSPAAVTWLVGILAMAGALVYSTLEWLPAMAGDVGFLLGRASGPAPAGGYGLLSLTHAANIANNLFLLAPGGLVLVVMLGFTRTTGWNRPMARALLLAGVPFLALILATRSIYRGIGAARDWDAYAPAGLFLALGAAVLLNEALERRERLLPLAWSAAVTSSLFAASWIAVNSIPESAINRADSLIHSKPLMPASPRAAALETLADVELEQGEEARSVQSLREAVALTPSPRLIWRAGTEEWKTGDRAGARQLFHWAAVRDAGFRARMEEAVKSDRETAPGDSLSLEMLEEVTAVDDSVNSAAGESGSHPATYQAGR